MSNHKDIKTNARLKDSGFRSNVDYAFRKIEYEVLQNKRFFGYGDYISQGTK